jgi:glycerol-3-phosphate dehydrogenase
VRDLESGQEFVVHAEVVVNASGPWTDLTNGALGGQTAFMGGTKGSHIVVDNPQLFEATRGREIFFENSDGRIVLIYPLKGRVLIGTTDVDADPRDRLVATAADVEYFFDLVRHVYPQIELHSDQIVYSYAGIRPLPRHEDTAPGFVSRDYRIVDTTIPGLEGTPVLSLVGGKWTTFRALGEQLADRVLEHLGNADRSVDTADLAIGGGKDYPRSEADRATWVAQHLDGLDAATVDGLLERYGTHASRVIEHLGDDATPLDSDPRFLRGEIAYIAGHEHVVHLADVVFRRTDAAMIGTVTTELLDELSAVLGEELGWDATRRAEEIAATTASLASDHHVTVRSAAHSS